MSCCTCYVGDPRDACGCECCYQELTIPEVLGSSLELWHEPGNYDPTGNPSGWGRWLDTSGNGRDSDGTSLATSPALGTFDGYSVPIFDGVQTFLRTIAPAADFSFLHQSVADVWFVIQPAAVALYDLGGTAVSPFSTGALWRLAAGGSVFQSGVVNGSGISYLNITTNTPPTVQPTRLRSTFLPGVPSLTANVLGGDGFASEATDITAAGAPPAGAPSFPLELGRQVVLGGSYYAGAMGEIVMASGISPAQRATVDALLAHRWGLPL